MAFEKPLDQIQEADLRAPISCPSPNALSALYPKDSEEKRLDAMLLAVPRCRPQPARSGNRVSYKEDFEVLEAGAVKVSYDPKTDTLSFILKENLAP